MKGHIGFSTVALGALLLSATLISNPVFAGDQNRDILELQQTLNEMEAKARNEIRGIQEIKRKLAEMMRHLAELQSGALDKATAERKRPDDEVPSEFLKILLWSSMTRFPVSLGCRPNFFGM